MQTVQQTNSQKPKPPASRLGKVQRGRVVSPRRYLIYGPEGVGKTTLASGAPDPIWFDVEESANNLDVARYQFRDDSSGYVPRTYEEVKAGLADLTNNEHTYKTLVIDTADKLESLIWQHMIRRDFGDGAEKSIEDYGYGKGFNKAIDEWRALCVALDRLRATRGMSIVLLAHSQIRTFKNPEGEDYDRYQPLINDKAAGLLKGWADVTGFACFEEHAGKLPGDKSGRVRGLSTGRRVLRLARTAAFDAKNRINLPDEVEMDIANPWGPLSDAVAAGSESKTKDIVAEVDAELARIGDDALTAKVRAAVATAAEKGDTDALGRYVANLKSRPSKSE